MFAFSLDYLFNRMDYFIRSRRQKILRSKRTIFEDDYRSAIEVEYFEIDPEQLPNLPTEFDLRAHYAFPPVGDQTNVCGACVPFSAVIAIGGAMLKKYEQTEFPDLSVQALIDCPWVQVNSCLKNIYL